MVLKFILIIIASTVSLIAGQPDYKFVAESTVVKLISLGTKNVSLKNLDVFH